MSKLRALLVEDDRAFARLIRERLVANEELEIISVAETLEAAMQSARELAGKIDLAIVDLALPDSEGVATISELHRACPRLPLLVLSGQLDVTIAVESMRHGAQDYICSGSGCTGPVQGRCLALAS